MPAVIVGRSGLGGPPSLAVTILGNKVKGQGPGDGGVVVGDRWLGCRRFQMGFL